MSDIELRAALAAYDAQYGKRAIGEQHAIPSGAVQRIEAVVAAARVALEELAAYQAEREISPEDSRALREAWGSGALERQFYVEGGSL